MFGRSSSADEWKHPFDLFLGIKKQNPPQIAIWIEDMEAKNRLADGLSMPVDKKGRAPGVYAVESDTTNVPVYTMGTKVEHLKLKDPKGKYISVSDLNTDYILIDFWAMWCAPCIKEIPNILKVHDKYKGKVSVYAISLDNTRQEWLEGIEKFKCRQFTHIYVGSWANEEARLITNSFGVTAIPANFLLDKDRRIIATDLKSDQLDAMLSQLLKQ